MLKLTKIETCDLSDLLKSVYECISMYEELSRRLGDVEVVLKEALNCHESLAVERLKATLLEYLLQEHLAKSCGKLIDKSADTEVLVAYDILLCLKYLSYVKSYLTR